LPSVSYYHSKEEYMEHHKAVPVPKGFRYNSYTNSDWETVSSIRKAITEHIDPNFKPV
jgi:UDP-N-acetylglucosamine 4,6-dehydratase/5-epimerase